MNFKLFEAILQKHDLLELLKNILDTYLEQVRGSEAIFISTLDGHMILQVSIEEYELEKLTPISGSILGLAESLANSLYRQKLHENISIMENNIFGLFKMYDQENTLFLGVVCNRTLSIAKMLNFAKATIKEINHTLENFE
ncbi:MAG: hypothetical protein L3J53_08085 [Proteobacteria bacterium]|nr:hypothetical protein [Pseudomonadota bacterium]